MRPRTPRSDSRPFPPVFLNAQNATALAQRGFVDGQKLKELKGPKGYRNVAFDLFTLAALLRENWDKVLGKTAVQAMELDQAETLADRLLTAIGAREQAPAVAAETADNRQRAFSLFVESYDHARRALTFVSSAPTGPACPVAPRATGAGPRSREWHPASGASSTRRVAWASVRLVRVDCARRHGRASCSVRMTPATRRLLHSRRRWRQTCVPQF
jgi:hypothetical protein